MMVGATRDSEWRMEGESESQSCRTRYLQNVKGNTRGRSVPEKVEPLGNLARLQVI